MWLLFAACVGGLAVACATAAIFALSLHCMAGRGHSQTNDRAPDPLAPWLHRLAMRAEPLTTWNYRHRMSVRLQRAGLRHWRPAHVFSLQTCLAIGVSVLSAPILLTSNRVGGAASDVSLQLVVTAGQCLGVGVIGWIAPQFWLRWLRDQRRNAISAGMPSYLDLLCLGLDCGMNLQGSIQLAIDHLPHGALRTEWNRMLLDIRSGMARPEALRQLADRADVTVIRHLVSTLAQGERAGLGLARILTDFACNERARRMLLAEKQAMRAPVKMLVPLALCIFPCTFLILGFPVLAILADLNP